MYDKQIVLLNKMAEDLWARAAQTPKASEIVTLTELARKCLGDARDIMEERSSNSLILYAECCAGALKEPDYDHYVGFCVRNGLKNLTEDDFWRFMLEVGLIG